MKMTFERPPERSAQRGHFVILPAELRKLRDLWAIIQTMSKPARIALAILAHHSTNGARQVPPTAKTQTDFGQMLARMRREGLIDSKAQHQIASFSKFGILPQSDKARTFPCDD